MLIVDDHEGFRRSARRLLELEGFLVVGDVPDARTALAAVDQLGPELVLLDVVLPDMDGFAVAELMSRLPRAPRVVLVSSRKPTDFGPRLGEGHAHAFIHKGDLSGAALAAIAEAPR